MSLDTTVLDALQQMASPAAIAAATGGLIAGGLAFAGLFVPTVASTLLPSPKESRLADHLPFDRVLPGGKTIICRDGTLVRCLRVEGRDIGFLPPEERERLFMMRKQWIDTLSESGITIRIFVVRDRADLNLSVDHDQPALRAIATRWNQSFSNSYRNQQIIVLSIKGGSRAAIQKLDEITDITRTILSEYRPIVLDQNDEDPRNRPLTFWSRITSPLTRPEPNGVGHNVSDAICSDYIVFDRPAPLADVKLPGGKKKTDETEARKKFTESGLIRFVNGDTEMYCACISIRALSDYTSEAFVSDISSIPAELVITHLVEPFSRIKAAAILDTQGRMALAQRLSLSTASQFEEAKDMIEGSDERAAAMAQYTMMIFVYGESIAEVNEIEQEVKKIASWHGYTPVREGAVSQASWFCQFPSYPIWPRGYKLFSRNVVSHVILDKQPEGLKNSDWGEGPIAMFRTASGTPYSFQFHITEEPAAVAHAVAIAPTGGGKTTLVTFLAGMAMRHPDLRVFIIDRHGGAYIFTRSVGGNYVVFDDSNFSSGNLSALNPFQMENTNANKSFLRSFLQALADVDDDDADSLEEIAFAVSAAYDNPGLPTEHRSLKNIYEAVFSKSKKVRKQLLKWVDDNQFGNILNAPTDNLDLASTRLVSFDFTNLYQHEDLARAVIMYLMHRIQATITELNVPALIFIDETEPVVQHPLFRTFYLQMLQEFRKRRAAVISAFQRPEAISKAGLGEVLRGQAQTTFFMPNPQAQEEEYGDWDLTDTELAYIKGRGVGQRFQRSVLIKRAGGESVVLDTDLGPLGPLLRIFRSDDNSRKLAEQMMEEHSEEWLHYYVNYRR